MSVNLFRDSAFDPETTQAMGQAFEFACIALKDHKDFELLKDKIAAIILNAARFGERDPLRLGAEAVKAFVIGNAPQKTGVR